MTEDTKPFTPTPSSTAINYMTVTPANSPKRPRALTRNSPCPRPDHFHNLRYCPEYKADIARVREAAANTFRDAAAGAKSYQDLADAANKAIGEALKVPAGPMTGIDVPATDPEDGPVTPT